MINAKRFECNYCNVLFKTKKSLANHTLNKHFELLSEKQLVSFHSTSKSKTSKKRNNKKAIPKKTMKKNRKKRLFWASVVKTGLTESSRRKH